jgi:hypothetical protein
MRKWRFGVPGVSRRSMHPRVGREAGLPSMVALSHAFARYCAGDVAGEPGGRRYLLSGIAKLPTLDSARRGWEPRSPLA